MSAKFTPAARTRMRTSPSPGVGSGPSRISKTSGAPWRGMTAWRTAQFTTVGSRRSAVGRQLQSAVVGRRSAVAVDRLSRCCRRAAQAASAPAGARSRTATREPTVDASREHREQRLLRVQPVLGLVEDDRGVESMTSSVTSSPRCAGRQCMKSAPARACAISAALTWYGPKISLALRRLALPGPSTPTRRCRRRRRRGRRRPDRSVSVEPPPSRARDCDRSRTAAELEAARATRRERCRRASAPPARATCATLLPSPTKAIVRPRSDPQRSDSVRQSASAWHGCSSSVSALTTRSRGAAAANASSRACAKVRTTAP